MADSSQDGVARNPVVGPAQPATDQSATTQADDTSPKSRVYAVSIVSEDSVRSIPLGRMAWLAAKIQGKKDVLDAVEKVKVNVVKLEEIDESKISSDTRNFKFQVEKFNYLINHVLQKESVRHECRKMLEHAAEEGIGKRIDVNLGNHYIDLLKSHMVRKASHDRADFMLSIYIWCMSMATVAVVGIYAVPWVCSKFSCDPTIFLAFFYAIIGASVGISLSSAIRLKTLTFAKLGQFDPYLFKPWERLFYIVILIIGVMCILNYDVVQLGIGNQSLNGFDKSPSLGILIGLVAGASEPALAAKFERVLEPAETSSPSSGGDGAAPAAGRQPS